MEIKKYIIIFLLFICIQSNCFIQQLSKINNSIDIDGKPNSYGIVLQAIFLIIAFILLETLVDNDFM